MHLVENYTRNIFSVKYFSPKTLSFRVKPKKLKKRTNSFLNSMFVVVSNMSYHVNAWVYEKICKNLFCRKFYVEYFIPDDIFQISEYFLRKEPKCEMLALIPPLLGEARGSGDRGVGFLGWVQGIILNNFQQKNLLFRLFLFQNPKLPGPHPKTNR